MQRVVLGLLAFLATSPFTAKADTPQEIIGRYAALAKQENPGFDGFSPESGRELYFTQGVIPGVGIVSCAACHLPDPTQVVIAHKSKVLCRACHVIYDEEHPHPEQAKKREIPPMAHSYNHARFTDPITVEDFLQRNCLLVLKRQCTTQEKGNVLTWLSLVK
ncbi:MAG: DUF1924 domain-containing protein [Burkholderiales bacterium]